VPPVAQSGTPNVRPRGPTESPVDDYDPDAGTLPEQRTALLRHLQTALGLDDATIALVRKIFEGSPWLGQGNPKISKRAMTKAECRERRSAAARLPAPDPRCGAPNMVSLAAPATADGKPLAGACIDQYEFPNIPCEYPVVWVRASEASEL